MPWPLLTKAVVLAVVLLLAAYDLLALWRAGPPATISRTVLAWSLEFPLVPFALGVLVGHLFCRQAP